MGPSLIYLQFICDQLKEALGLADDMNVSALIDVETDPHFVQGWCIVKVQEDGSMQPIDDKRYKTIAELLKQQMMKDAIDLKINRDTLYDLKPIIHEKYLDYKIGDKVKLIIIKED